MERNNTDDVAQKTMDHLASARRRKDQGREVDEQ